MIKWLRNLLFPSTPPVTSKGKCDDNLERQVREWRSDIMERQVLRHPILETLKSHKSHTLDIWHDVYKGIARHAWQVHDLGNGMKARVRAEYTPGSPTHYRAVLLTDYARIYATGASVEEAITTLKNRISFMKRWKGEGK